MKHLRLTYRSWFAFALAGSLLTAFQVPACAAETDYSQRIISFLLIGGSTTEIEDRCVGWSLRQRGWDGFVRLVVRPQLNAGVRRIQIHNPFGTLPDESMQFDQYIHSRSAGLAFLTEGFVDAWKPVIQGRYTQGEPVEVIAYLGKLQDDPDFQKLQDAGDNKGWLARAVVSLSLPLEAGMSIGFDASASATEQSPTHRLTELLQSLGTRVYIEARPYKNTPHWFDNNVIITDKFWKRSDPQRYPGDSGKWAARNDQLTGEIVRIVFPEHAEDPDNWKRDLRRVLDDGHTAAVPVYNMLGNGKRLEDLLRPDTPDTP